MGTYVNNLRLLEIATGGEDGTWGTKTNLNLELIADAFGSGTEAITTNADTHTTTIADGAADEGRAIFLKYTGTLDSACTITLAPNTVNKLWFIENATSGSQNIIVSQGSGANVTIGNGNVAAIYTDGAGSGAAVLDAFADLELSSKLTVAGNVDFNGDLDVDGTTNLDAVDIDGAVQIDSTVTVGVDDTGYDVKFFGATSGAYMLWDESADDLVLAGAAGLDVAGDIDVDGTTNLDVVDIDGAVDMASTLTVAGDVTVDTDTLFVDVSSDRVGLGTTSPGTMLELKESSTGTGDDVIRLRGDGNNSDNTVLGALEWYNTDASGDQPGVVCRIEGVSGNSNGHMGELLFKTHDGSESGGEGSNPVERMRIDNSGNVGIGTTSPDASLHVDDGTDISMSSTAAGQIKIGGNAYNAAIALDGSNMNIYHNSSSRGIVLGTDETARMTIASGGNVGIGTTSPSALFTVMATDATPSIYAVRNDSTIAANNTLMSLVARGDLGSGEIAGGTIQIRADEEWVQGSDSGTRITFTTTTNGTWDSDAERMRIDHNGNVGIGATNPSEKLDVGGNVTISGSLSKGSGSFKIDHPLPAMSDTHHLVHSFIEGPKADLIYRGSVALVDGAATVDLDAAATMTSGTWEILCRDPQVWVQNEDGWTQVRGSISGSTLSIEAQDADCTDTVSWLIVAERKDPNIVGAGWTDEEGRVIVEPLKTVGDNGE